MTEFLIARCSTLRVKSCSYKCSGLKRSLSSRSICKFTDKLEIILNQKKVKKNNCKHVTLNQQVLKRKLACDECKSKVAQNDEAKILNLLPNVDKKCEDRNSKRRSARPLRKLQVIDE